MRQITLITTGGTIEKTYDEMTGELANRRTIVNRMLQRLRLERTNVQTIELMSKDSLLMTEADRTLIVETVRRAGGGTGDGGGGDGGGAAPTGIVVLHGTDTLEQTGEALVRGIAGVRVPIVLTGAMRPFEMKRSDALQNLTEALFATGVLGAGVWCVAHGRALRFPGVVKDRTCGTFRMREDQET